ncbi:MAG: GNAT family N-acetyltransferase [Chloroflexi bacterium]|nr:GNAT family N-acetyltransferase [Chloroflexota bacterium]MBT3670509.1 GNAT family N-acetyltransferase [Chloroflexota bacterium]MBT4003727.1 GNAT family N-acetyltransferase [Chloroflexota bacterium]MBT4534896.1 GNAT family N-acetyltransferase [Chloroflexota bacterium]MBT4681553.1 GNAT family N-acetyltransferase [Chloroflexota bacterium]
MNLEKELFLEGLNLPEGFSFRPAKLTDVLELTTLFNLISEKVEGVKDFTPHELENDLKSPGFDIAENTIIICDQDGKIVAYQDMFALSSIPVRPIVWGRVHPDHMNRGFGTALFRWGMERAKSVLDKVPKDVRVAVRTWNVSTWNAGKEMLENLGLEIKRHYFEMEIEMNSQLPNPVWPDGIKIFSFQYPKEAKDLYRAFEESFKDHYGFVAEEFDEGFKQFEHMRINEEGFDPDLWFLAKDSNEIAGFSLCRKWSHESREDGHVSVLGVRPKWRKKGLGLALLQHSFTEYWKRGQQRVTLGVDGNSITGAVKLYERAGMKKFKQVDSYEIELRPGREIARV